jgi:predicted SAM-dependent methyltransferase
MKIEPRILAMTAKPESKAFYCPFCKRPTISPKNIREGIIMCAICTSFERQRFLKYVYEDEILNIGKNVEVLQFAPEKSIYDTVRKYENVKYTCCDLMPELYPYADGILQEDGMSLSFKDKQFDVIIHNHILEHMPDDIKFIKETMRILKDDGKVIVSIPFYKDELCHDSYMTDEERTEHYGQADHVRRYGKDILDVLKIEGVKIDIINQTDYLTHDEIESIKAHQHISGDYYMIMTKER